MFRIRSERTVNAILIVVLVLAVVAALLFGAVVHAIVPHSHEGGEAMWQELHAALRSAEKYLVFLWLPVFTFLGFITLTVAIPRFEAEPVRRIDRLLHRGVIQYRRFG